MNRFSLRYIKSMFLFGLYMPFNPALNMLRENISGFYGDVYLTNLVTLMAHTIIPLSLGLIFRKPIISVKEKYSKKLDQSHLMGK